MIRHSALLIIKLSN